MSYICDFCQKKPDVGFNVSHSNRHTKTRRFPNLQHVKLMISSNARKFRVCTKCLKSITKDDTRNMKKMHKKTVTKPSA